MSDTEITEGPGTSAIWIVNYLPMILWQRRYYVIACLIVALSLGLRWRFCCPTTYRSTATLLVQSQDLPTTIVDAPVTGAVDQRVARIRQQVLSRGDLIQLIEQNGLYEKERRVATAVEDHREDAA